MLFALNRSIELNAICIRQIGPPNPDNVPEDGKLKSEMMIKDNRRYYLDLKENTRGRFLRVNFIMMVDTRSTIN